MYPLKETTLFQKNFIPSREKVTIFFFYNISMVFQRMLVNLHYRSKNWD